MSKICNIGGTGTVPTKTVVYAIFYILSVKVFILKRGVQCCLYNFELTSRNLLAITIHKYIPSLDSDRRLQFDRSDTYRQVPTYPFDRKDELKIKGLIVKELPSKSITSLL